MIIGSRPEGVPRPQVRQLERALSFPSERSAFFEIASAEATPDRFILDLFRAEWTVLHGRSCEESASSPRPTSIGARARVLNRLGVANHAGVGDPGSEIDVW